MTELLRSMKLPLAGIVIPGTLAAAGLAALVVWASSGPGVKLSVRDPGLDGAPAAGGGKELKRPIVGEPIAGQGRQSALAGAWPGFRGADRDAISKEKTALARQWPSAGPRRLWTIPLGEGYASAAVRDGCVYVLDHVPDTPIDMLRGLQVADRKTLSESLSSASPGDMKKVEAAVQKFFAVEGESPSGRKTVSKQQFADLTDCFRSLLTTRRDALLHALSEDSLEEIDRSADTMRCLSLDDGREIWRNAYPVAVAHNHGITRTIPAVSRDSVVSMGPKCHVVCWDAKSGKSRWLLDLVIDQGAAIPPWYAGQCPLIDPANDRLIVAPGGRALVMAIDYHTGKSIWECPNVRSWQMTHVSVVPMVFHGRRTYVYCGKKGVAGVSADDGKLLWDTPDWQISMATCPTPVVVGEDRLFFCGGYNSGALMLQLKEEGGRIVPRTLFRLTARQFGSEQQTPILFEGHLYGVRQKDQQFVCLDLDGKELWNSGREKFGSGPYMIAEGMIYAMNDDGVLTLAEATSTAYKRLARAQVIDEGSSSWGPMALAAGRLIVRDLTRMVCLDIAEKKP